MAKGKASLVGDVLGRVQGGKPGFKTWFDRLPEDARAELEAVRAAFDPAVHQNRAYALAVIAAAQERGWQISGEKQVIAWLKHKS